jgi:pimeloyl-ACP methyl ester carboxylesterase
VTGTGRTVPVWGGGGARVVLVHGTLNWGVACFAGQRPLGARFRTGGGTGRSPDVERSDYEVDAEDIGAVPAAEAGGAQLVGHSYGAVSAMFAAARYPEVVRSLVLIEPSALRAAEAHPVVAAALARIRAFVGRTAPAMSPEEFLTASTEPYGLPVPELTPERLRATRTAMRERPCWDAEVPLAALATATYPKAVLNGTWEAAHPAYREFVGDAMAACGETLAHAIHAGHIPVPETDHFPHRDHPTLVNDVLADIWTRRSAGA